MADRDDQSNLPPIPDGGLTDAMPDWLRRPPAWRTLPDREVTAPEPEEAAALPEPDESVIDPRTFLGDDDLPAWLRDLGRRRTTRPPVEGQEAVPYDDNNKFSHEGSSADRRSESSPLRFRPTTPPAARAASGADIVARGAAPQPPLRSEPASSPPWQGAWIVAMLAALLVVAIVVIIVLVL